MLYKFTVSVRFVVEYVSEVYQGCEWIILVRIRKQRWFLVR
jgi:hypothetical protein